MHWKWRLQTRDLIGHTLVVKEPPELVMMTLSNGNIFLVTDLLCVEFTGHRKFPSQKPVTRSFDVF